MKENILKRSIKKITRRFIWRPLLLAKIKNKKGPLKLNLGAGNNPIKGWVNADFIPKNLNILYIDVRKKMPFRDNTFDYIISEHLIEHLSREEGKKMLKECFRILKKNGKIRISTPNLKFITSLYNENKDNKYYIKKITKRFLKDIYHEDYRPVFIINNAFYNWGHKFLYDEKLLVETLQEIGFKDISREVYGGSKDKNLNKMESHEKGVGDVKVCQIESIVLEASKK